MRPEKESMAENLRASLQDCEYVLMVDYRGLTVEQLSEFRSRLDDAGATCRVVKNTFLAKTGREQGWEAPAEALTGPTAIISGSGEVTTIAGIVRDFRKKNERPTMKGGVLAGAPFSARDAEAMALLPPRQVLLGMLVGTIAAPMAQLAGALRQKVASVLYVLKAVAEKKSQGN